MNAHEEPVVYGIVAVHVSQEQMRQLQRVASESVLATAKELLEEAAVPYTTEVLTGPIPEVIARRADEFGCDNI